MTKLTRFKQKENLRFIKVSKKSVLWGLVFVFVLSQIIITVHTSTSGADLADLENKADELMHENKRLSEELIMQSSLTATEKSAEELGFIKPQDTVYLGGESVVSLLQ